MKFEIFIEDERMLRHIEVCKKLLKRAIALYKNKECQLWQKEVKECVEQALDGLETATTIQLIERED